MDFESLLSRLILAAAIVGGLALLSLVVERRRRRSSSVFHSPAFRAAHVQPTQKAEPTVADVIPVDFKHDPRRVERGNPKQEAHYRESLAGMSDTDYERASNHRWF